MSFGDAEERRPLLIRDSVQVPIAPVTVVNKASTFDDFLAHPGGYLQNIVSRPQRARAIAAENEKKLPFNITLVRVSISTSIVGFMLSILVAVNDILQNYYAGYAVGGPRCEADILKGDAATAYCATNDCFSNCSATSLSLTFQPLLGLTCAYTIFEFLLSVPALEWEWPSHSLKMQILNVLGLFLMAGAILGLSTDWLGKTHSNEGFNEACIEKFAQLCLPATNSSKVCDLINIPEDDADCFNGMKPSPPIVEFGKVFGVSQAYALLPVLALTLFKIMLMLFAKKFKASDPIIELPETWAAWRSEGEGSAWVYDNPLSFNQRPREQRLSIAKFFAGYHGVQIEESTLKYLLRRGEAGDRRKAAVVAACFRGGCLESVGAGAAGAGARLG